MQHPPVPEGFNNVITSFCPALFAASKGVTPPPALLSLIFGSAFFF